MAERAAAYKVRGPLTELTLRSRPRTDARARGGVLGVRASRSSWRRSSASPFAAGRPTRCRWLSSPVRTPTRGWRRCRPAPTSKPNILSEAEARLALARGRVVLVVSGDDTPVVSVRPDAAREPRRPPGCRRRAAARRRARRCLHRGRAEVTEAGARYVDFLVPGLLGMNLMGTGMWGIGFSLVVARNGNLLKRLVAAPVRRSHLLGAQLTSRLIFLIPEAGALLLFAYFALGVPLRGSLLLLIAISLLGALAFSGLGLLTAARPRTIEGVSGIMNLVMVPMWIFSGIFFSTERFPAAMQPFVQALPLTALNDALRGVMLEGTGLAAAAGTRAARRVGSRQLSFGSQILPLAVVVG